MLGSLHLVRFVSLALALAACSSDPAKPSGTPTKGGEVFGEKHSGQYHLGPVDFAESEWHNACAPGGGYRESLRETVGLTGQYLAGVSHELSLGGGICDSCILIETELGRSIVARVVTYGEEAEPGDIDVSPSVYAELNQDEYPRSMTFSWVRCPESGNVLLEFQDEANPYWTSLWLRNASLPLTKVEVKSANHAEFVELSRGTDGTFTDASGFGEGAFTLRLTASDDSTLTIEQPGFEPGALVDSGAQFR